MIAAATGDELTCEDVQTAAQVGQLNTLELYRLRFRPDLPADVRAAMMTAWAALPVPETVYPISDGHSWHDGVDRAMADDSGTDAADDW